MGVIDPEERVREPRVGDAAARPGRAILWRSESGLPEGADLLACLGVMDQAYTYVVATAAIERARGGRKGRISDLVPAHQRAPSRGSEVPEPHLLFHRALRLLMNQPLLTRAEERVLLQRTIEIAAQGPDLARVLRHDVFAWREALAELAEKGYDLASPLPAELESRIHPRVRELLSSLQGTYRVLTAQYGRFSFEEAAYRFLDADYWPTPHVIMEGFTFLTPLQRHYVTVSQARGATVHLIYPYRAAQSEGFAVMAGTYQEFAASGARALPASEEDPGSDLGMLQRSLFAAEMEEGTAGEGEVTLLAYRHRHLEVAGCLRRLQDCLTRYEANEIAVVTRNAHEFSPLLQEEADRIGIPVRLAVPSRMLLLTPLGQFVLALYSIWRDGDLCLGADGFETLLASGWLGARVQETADRFQTVRGQWFDRCQSAADWSASFARLREFGERLPADSRSPAAGLDAGLLGLWEEAVRLVGRLCARLFDGEGRSIGEHVRRLLDELSALAPESMREAEREVLARIREALEELADATSLRISPSEFGDVLNSLVTEYNRPAEEAGAPTPEEEDRVWVTTPEGIDNCRRPVVIYMGVDDRRVPRDYAEPWPFQEDRIGEHQDRERYLFLAVVRAAQRELYLSYARLDEEGRYGPSLYLEEAASILGRTIDSETEPEAAPAVPHAPPELPLLRARRKQYTLAEVAHYALCPRRYMLERIDPRARQYPDAFQFPFLAQAHWLDRVLQRLADGGSTVLQGRAHAAMMDAMQAAERDVRAAFPALPPRQWQTIAAYVRRELEQTARFVGNYSMAVLSHAGGEFLIIEGDRAVQVTAPIRFAVRKGRLLHPFTRDMLREEWLLPGIGAHDDAEPDRVEARGVPVLPSLWRAAHWWDEATRAAFYARILAEGEQGHQPAFVARARAEQERFQREIGGWIAEMEAGRYPEHPGRHCMLCPVRGDCLGLEG